MKITIVTETVRIPVGISFAKNSQAETFGEQTLKLNNLNVKKSMGFIKRLVPQWYKETMEVVRDQKVAKRIILVDSVESEYIAEFLTAKDTPHHAALSNWIEA
jgi:hypothetical protein